MAPAARLFAVILALLAILASPASAGTAEQPEVSDADSDVQAFGAPAPVGFGWADLRSAWFGRDGDELVLSMAVAPGSAAPPVGELGVTFAVGGQHFIAGYTVVPGLYAGGFLSKADANGDVPDSEQPQAMPGTFADGLVEVRFPVEGVDPEGTVGVLSGPWGWSESTASNGAFYRLDSTEAGQDFAWLAGPEGNGTSPAPLGSGEREMPLAPAVAFVALAVAAWIRRR